MQESRKKTLIYLLEKGNHEGSLFWERKKNFISILLQNDVKAFDCNLKTYRYKVWLCIRVRVDPDPTLEHNPEPDPAAQEKPNQDPILVNQRALGSRFGFDQKTFTVNFFLSR